MGKHSETSMRDLDHKTNRMDSVWGNRALWTAILFACATLLSFAKPVVLHDGGALTFFSLLFLWLVTYFFGPRHGAAVGVLFGLVKLGVTYVTGEAVNFAPGALLLEYPLACAAFALGGLLPRRDGKGGAFNLRAGYVVGVLAMGVCYVVSAVLFYPPDRVGFLNNLLFCIAYDMSYLAIEAAMTLVLLAFPQVVDAIEYLRHVATHKRQDPTLLTF